jgi:hypothetical protein
MNEKLAHRFSTLVREPSIAVESQASQDTEGVDDLGAFGWLRGMRERAIMLELRKRNGNVLAIDYGGLEIELDPSEGLVLYAMSGRKVSIRGRNLNVAMRPAVQLFHGLTRHRVPWIQEAQNGNAFQAPKEATLIESIEW